MCSVIYAMHEIDNPLRKGEFVLIFSNAMLEDIFVDGMLTFLLFSKPECREWV